MARSLIRLYAIALGAVAASSLLDPAPVRAAGPSGTWLTEDGRARVRTEPCGAGDASLCGYVVWVDKPSDEKGRPRLDDRNPDAAKHARPVLGHQLLGLRPNADGRFEGRIYNADDGKSYDVQVWSEKASELTVKGCMLAVLCSSQVWKRTTDALPGELKAPTDSPGGPRADREWASARPASGPGKAPAGTAAAR